MNLLKIHQPLLLTDGLSSEHRLKRVKEAVGGENHCSRIHISEIDLIRCDATLDGSGSKLVEVPILASYDAVHLQGFIRDPRFGVDVGCEASFAESHG